MKHNIMRWITLALVCLLVPALGFAEGLEMQEGLEPAEPIHGMQTYPEGMSEEQAACVFRYEYPQFVARGAAEEAINAYYQLACGELQSVIIPASMEEAAEQAQADFPASRMELSYQITANTHAYLSIVQSDKRFLGYVESERISADVFALEGVYAGQPITLSQLMEGESIPGLGAGEMPQFIHKLVWRIVEEQWATQQRDYYEDLTEDSLKSAFNPEKDFYMDMDGNLVFFVQAGVIASEVEGILTYPFAVDELLVAAVE